MNAVDTNVFVYAVDHSEPLKQARAVDCLRQLKGALPETVLLWQVAGEYLSCLRRWESLGRVSASDVRLYLLRLLSAHRLVIPSQPVLDRSLDLSSRYSLSHWDSMLLAACIEAGVDTLYSEDLSDGMTYDSVTVVNPFV